MDFEAMSKEIREKQDALKAELNALGKEFFKETTQKMFEENPNLVSFTWTQYTPYWCDGDECIFGVNCDYPEVTLNTGEVLEDSWDLKDNPDELNLYNNVVTFLRTLDEDIMKSLFGDHVEVTVMPDNIEVRDYEHE